MEKRKHHVVDESFRGTLKDKKKLRLCTTCFIKKFKDYLVANDTKAIVVEPFSGFNAYQFYTFDEMVLKYGWPENKVRTLRSLGRQVGSCVSCGKPAKLHLFPPDVYERDPFDLNIDTSVKGQLLCPDCLSNALQNIIEREQIFFKEVLPPGQGEGLITPFEV